MAAFLRASIGLAHNIKSVSPIEQPSASSQLSPQNGIQDSILKIALFEQNIQLDNFPYYVEALSLGQKEKQIIGFMSEGHVPIVFDSDIESEMNNFLKKEFQNEQGKQPLYVRLNRLNNITIENKTRTSMSLSFFTKRENKILLLYTVSAMHTHNISIFEKKTKTIGKNIVFVMRKCFQDFLERHENNWLRERAVSIAAFNTFQIDALHFPIIGAEQRSTGVFYSYADFRENKIDTTAEFRMFQIMPSDTLVKKAKFNNVKRKSIWGLWDGSHYYVRYKTNFHRITFNREKKLFEISFRTRDFSNVAGDVATVYFFGIVGFGIKKIIEIESSKDLVLPLDLVLGLVSYTPKLEKSVIIECVGKGDAIAISVENDGRKICKISKGEYFRFAANSLDGIVRLTLKSSFFEREIIFDPMATQRILIEHKPHKIAVEYAPFVNPIALESHLRKNRKEVGLLAPALGR